MLQREQVLSNEMFIVDPKGSIFLPEEELIKQLKTFWGSPKDILEELTCRFPDSAEKDLHRALACMFQSRGGSPSIPAEYCDGISAEFSSIPDQEGVGQTEEEIRQHIVLCLNWETRLEPLDREIAHRKPFFDAIHKVLEGFQEERQRSFGSTALVGSM